MLKNMMKHIFGSAVKPLEGASIKTHPQEAIVFRGIKMYRCKYIHISIYFNLNNSFFLIDDLWQFSSEAISFIFLNMPYSL